VTHVGATFRREMRGHAHVWWRAGDETIPVPNHDPSVKVGPVRREKLATQEPMESTWAELMTEALEAPSFILSASVAGL
jgi:hypothetical protein